MPSRDGPDVVGVASDTLKSAGVSERLLETSLLADLHDFSWGYMKQFYLLHYDGYFNYDFVELITPDWMDLQNYFIHMHRTNTPEFWLSALQEAPEAALQGVYATWKDAKVPFQHWGDF